MAAQGESSRKRTRGTVPEDDIEGTPNIAGHIKRVKAEKQTEQKMIRSTLKLDLDSDAVKFWEELKKAELKQLSNGAWELEVEMAYPTFPTNRVYVRQSYKTIYDSYIAKNQHTLVSGNPGTGKTVFSLYVMYRLVKQGDANIYILYCSCGITWLFSPLCVQYLSNIQESAYCAAKLKGNFYYLFDCSSSKVAVPNPIIARSAKKSIVFSSPDQENYKRYYKEVILEKGQLIYMPIWSWEEICECFKAKLTAVSCLEDIKTKFVQFGGIPRYLFNDKADDVQLLDAAINDLTTKPNFAEAFHKLVSSHPMIGANFSHKLVHIIPHVSNYGSYYIDFASHYVAERIASTQLRETSESFIRIIKDLTEVTRGTAFAGVNGKVFEPIAHYMISKGGEFKVRDLEIGGTQTTWEIPVAEREVFDTLSSTKKYRIPVKKNFESVDSIGADDTAYQMTVSDNHPVKACGLINVMQKLKLEEMNLCFVVPPGIFNSFRKQCYVYEEGTKPPKIHQFVLCMEIK